MMIDFVKYKHIKSASEVCFIPGAWSYHLTTQTTPAQNADVRCCLIVRIPLRPSFGIFSNKANASFNQYVIARRYARFSYLTSRRGTICYIVFYLLFSNPVLVLYLSCTCSVLVRFPRGGYILVNNSSVVNSILAKANHFCFKCPRNLR